MSLDVMFVFSYCGHNSELRKALWRTFSSIDRSRNCCSSNAVVLGYDSDPCFRSFQIKRVYFNFIISMLFLLDIS
jgi:hypothetical protein